MLGRFARSPAAFLTRNSGATAVEFTVMVAMVLMAIITAISMLEHTRAGS
jgi:Flp pilus assembly pilin Flp